MNIFIVGTGNVASSLGHAFVSAGHHISGVLGRDKKKTTALAKKLDAKPFLVPGQIPPDADIYLVAIKDDAIENVVETLPSLEKIVVHTSGAVPARVLKKFSRFGVFYPVESISPGYPETYMNVPVCTEASSSVVQKSLSRLANSISRKTFILNSEQRVALHVAAVFANNFTNHMLGIASGILAEHKLPLQILEPLATSTIKKAFRQGALKSRTGPAYRKDLKTIKKHLEFLKNHDQYRQLYRMVTRQIMDAPDEQQF
jgi:predicted short-subunit dehydrogenase-like oxidoreductase (DUF2520 family)